MNLKKSTNKINTAISWCKKNPRKFLSIIFVILYPLIITFFLGWIERYSFESPILSTLGWMITHPVAILINWIIIFLLSVFFWIIFRKPFISVFIVSIFSVICGLTNYFKLFIRGEPVYPGDILFPGEVTNIVGETRLIVPSIIIIFSVVVIILVIIAIFIKVPKFNFKKSLIYILIIITIGCLSYPLYFANTWTQKLIGIDDAIWSQRYNYETNGFFGAFLMQTKYLRIDKPDGYSVSKAKSLLNESSEPAIIGNTPNVIFVMNESLWDPTRLPGVTFNIDPLKNLKELQKESIYGDLLVDPFGGNTANTEFEALTGFSMNALPGGVAYQQYVKQQLPALPELLKSQGYTTEAIHPYHAWFWNRKEVYPLLGIDRFYSITDFSDSDIKGKYISDEAVGNRIISDYENNKSTGKPFFAQVVTMQNHGSYEKDRYGSEQKVVVNSKDISSTTLSDLNVYSQGVKDADDNLAHLVEYFRNVNEPTIIVFYGDHLPTLGGDYGAYRSTGLISKKDLSNADLYKLHTNPFIIWSNKSTKSQNVGIINSFYLAPTMLKNAGISMNNYFNYLDNMMDGVKACNKTVCLDKNGKYISIKNSSIKSKLTNQAILQYYYLFEKHN